MTNHGYDRYCNSAMIVMRTTSIIFAAIVVISTIKGTGFAAVIVISTVGIILLSTNIINLRVIIVFTT